MDQRSMFATRVEMDQAAPIAGEDGEEQLLAELSGEVVVVKGIQAPVRLALKASAAVLLVAVLAVVYMSSWKEWKSQAYEDFSMSTDPADVLKYFNDVSNRPLPLEGAAPDMLEADGHGMHLSRHISGRDRNLAVLPTDKVIEELTADMNENKKHLERMQRLLGQKNGNLHVLSEQRQANIASCVFDGLLASDKLANAGVAINAAVHTCPSPKKTNACVANVGMSIASFAASASFIAQMAFVCPEKPEPYAMCVSPIMNLIQGFGQITLAAGGLQQSCGHDFIHDGIGSTVFSPVSVSESSKVAVCVILVNQAVFFLGRAGLQIDAAVKACDAKHIKKKGALCSAQVTSVIMAFTGAAATLSGSAAKCAEKANLGAACSANINNIIGGLASIANFASAMANGNCEKHPR